MLQELVIFLAFIAAAFYMGRMIYASFAAKSGCAKSCGACSSIDFKKIQKDLEKKQATLQD